MFLILKRDRTALKAIKESLPEYTFP